MPIALMKLTTELGFKGTLFPWHGVDVPTTSECDAEIARQQIEDEVQTSVHPEIYVNLVDIYANEPELVRAFELRDDTGGFPVVFTSSEGPYVG